MVILDLRSTFPSQKNLYFCSLGPLPFDRQFVFLLNCCTYLALAKHFFLSIFSLSFTPTTLGCSWDQYICVILWNKCERSSWFNLLVSTVHQNSHEEFYRYLSEWEDTFLQRVHIGTSVLWIFLCWPLSWSHFSPNSISSVIVTQLLWSSIWLLLLLA